MKRTKQKKLKPIELLMRFLLITGLLSLSVLLMWNLIKFPFLPNKYVVGIGVLLLLINFSLIYLQVIKNVRPKLRLASKIVMGLLVIALAFGNLYLSQTERFIQGITEDLYDIDTVSLVVLNESDYESLDDIINEKFGVDNDEEHHVIQAIADIQTNREMTLDLEEFEDHFSLVTGLYDGLVEGIFINEAYRTIIEEQFPNFTLETKVIYNVDIKTLIDSGKGVEVTKNPFTLYISGIDVYGDISLKSRSDVNILMTVNPITKVILLTTIPRDSYLQLGCFSSRAKDKLTHAAVYGINCSISTMEDAFGIDINYYARVNFTSVVNMVDAIGGIDVVSTHSFTSNDNISYQKGINHLNGMEALSFARDRRHQEDGDEDRGKNQLRVMTAIFNKIISPQILTNYFNILKAVENNFQTNLPYESILALAKMQLNDMSSWKIISNNVQGQYGYDFSHAMWDYLSMFYPNKASMKNATELINENLAGTLIEQPESIIFPVEPRPAQTPDPRPPKVEIVEDDDDNEDGEENGGVVNDSSENNHHDDNDGGEGDDTSVGSED